MKSKDLCVKAVFVKDKRGTSGRWVALEPFPPELLDSCDTISGSFDPLYQTQRAILKKRVEEKQNGNQSGTGVLAR